MITNTARRLTFGETPAERTASHDAARPLPTSSADRDTSAWRDPSETLSLVRDGSRFEVMLGEAASWADEITLCVTAQQSALARAPWWGELLARGSKCERIYLRRAEQADGGLLHRLHDTGALRLLEGGGKQVAGNLLLFAREGELRALLSHIPFERAVSGAAFGALLSFRGRADGELARACRAQVESWSERARIPSGSELDALAFDARRLAPLPELTAPGAPLRVVSDAAELDARVSRFVAESGDTLDARSVDGGYRLQLRSRDEARAPFVLTLSAGPAWDSGNTLLLDAGDGRALLVWRGGLLGPSRSKQDLLWSQARLRTVTLEDDTRGPAQPVALIADSGAALAPQLAAFARELRRLSDVFEVPPPPLLGDVLADFASLAPQQQTLLLWRALLGLGALQLDVATLTAAQVLRDQGYLHARDTQPGSPALKIISVLLVIAAERGHSFDSPSASTIRAVQSDLTAYSEDDWLECLLRALPEGRVIPRRNAQRLAFEHARRVWGLWGRRLERHGAAERALEAALASAIRRGFLTRVGADGVERLGPFATRPELPESALRAPDEPFLGGWSRELEGLPALQRLLLERRAGVHPPRESLVSVAQRLGLSLERARQLEAEAWLKVTASTWAQTLRARLHAALAGARALRVSRLIADDAWWQDLDQHLELAQALFENVLGAELHHVTLRRSGEHSFARFRQAELDKIVADLLERAAQLPAPAPLDDYASLAAAAAETLDPCLAEHLLEELMPHLELDADDPLRVVRFIEAPTPSSEPVDPASSEPLASASEEHLRLEDTVRSVFRAAGTPLSSEAVAERVRRRLDVEDAALERLLARAPFVRRNPDQYGLLSRDVPGGPEAIATALDTLTSALQNNQRPLDTREAFALVQSQINQAWSLELLCSLIGSDPALSLSSSHAVILKSWDAPPDSTPKTRIFPGMPAPARTRLRELLQHPPTPSTRLVQRLRGALAELERAADDDLVQASLARQLCHLYERLLEHVAREPAHDQRLVPAAMEQFLETLTRKDDDDEAHVPRETLTTARRTLAALLQHLELDWL